MSAKFPTVFIGHGSPMQAIEPSRYTAAWEQLGRTLPRPRAIVAVSAHWYTEGTKVTAQAHPKTIHDFYGFPPPLYAIRYDAAGSPALATQVATLLRPTRAHLDLEWGLDHGTWSVLKYMYPAADIPVIQLSIDGTLSARAHYQLGGQLSALRDEGVLVLGSGNVVHNLRALRPDSDAAPYTWAQSFNQQVKTAVLNGDHELIIDYSNMGEAARQSVPTPEHYLPLMYVLGLKQPDEPVSIIVDGIDLGSIGMLTVQVGTAI